MRSTQNESSSSVKKKKSAACDRWGWKLNEIESKCFGNMVRFSNNYVWSSEEEFILQKLLA